MLGNEWRKRERNWRRGAERQCRSGRWTRGGQKVLRFSHRHKQIGIVHASAGSAVTERVPLITHRNIMRVSAGLGRVGEEGGKAVKERVMNRWPKLRSGRQREERGADGCTHVGPGGTMDVLSTAATVYPSPIERCIVSSAPASFKKRLYSEIFGTFVG